MRMHDNLRWQDKKFKALSAEAKLLFIYLNDICDYGGFTPVELEKWYSETSITGVIYSNLLQLGDDGLAIRRPDVNTNIVWLWIPSFASTLLNGHRIPANSSFGWMIYTKLEAKEYLFPEVRSMYLDKAKGLIDGKLMDLPMRNSRYGRRDALYIKLVNAGLHKTCSFKIFKAMRKEGTEVDWKKIVTEIVKTVTPEQNTYACLRKLSRDEKFKKVGK